MASRIKGITVEIGGDTTGLDKALKSVNSSIKTTQSGLKDVSKLLKLDPTNTELLTQKQKLLKDAIGSTKEKLDALKLAQEQAKAQLESGDLGQDKYDALQREIIETEQELKRLQEQAIESNAALAKIEEVGDKLQTAGDKISGVGQKLLPVTAAVAGLGTAAVKTTADFDTSMSQVQATMGITKDAMSELNGESVNTMEALRDLAKQMGSETAFSASECADAMNYLALAGYDTQEIYDGSYADKYEIGNYKPLDLGEEGIVNMQLVAKKSDTLSDGSGLTATTWISIELLKTAKRMNPAYDSSTHTGGGIGGWETSELRSYLSTTIKPLIPENVRGSIKAVQKAYLGLDASLQQFEGECSDELWVPSVREVCYDYHRVNVKESNGPRYYAVYCDFESSVKYNEGHANFYYLRTVQDSNHYYAVSPTNTSHSPYVDADPYQMSNSYKPRIALGFCI